MFIIRFFVILYLDKVFGFGEEFCVFYFDVYYDIGIGFVDVFFLCVIFKYVIFGRIVRFVDGEFLVMGVGIYFGCYGDDYYVNFCNGYFVLK